MNFIILLSAAEKSKAAQKYICQSIEYLLGSICLQSCCQRNLLAGVPSRHAYQGGEIQPVNHGNLWQPLQDYQDTPQGCWEPQIKHPFNFQVLNEEFRNYDCLNSLFTAIKSISLDFCEPLLFLFFKTESHPGAQACLELTMQLRLHLNTRQSSPQCWDYRQVTMPGLTSVLKLQIYLFYFLI